MYYKSNYVTEREKIVSLQNFFQLFYVINKDISIFPTTTTLPPGPSYLCSTVHV